MKLVHENHVRLLVRTYTSDPLNTPLMPGDLVRHWQDRGSSGMIIAVSTDGRLDPENLEALVLWSKLPFNGNYPSMTGRMPDEKAQHLYDNQIISRKTLLEHFGFDPDETPDE